MSAKNPAISSHFMNRKTTRYVPTAILKTFH